MKLYAMIHQQEKQNIDFQCVPFCIERSYVKRPEFLHLHDFQQLTVILSGQGELSVNGLRYIVRPGNVYVISSYSPHCLRNAQTLEFVNILFHTEDLLRYAGSLKQLPGFQALFMLPTGDSAEPGAAFDHILSLDYHAHQKVEQLVLGILEEVRRREAGSEIMVQSSFMILVALLSRLYQGKKDHSPQENALYRMVSYISRNYDRPLRIADLAQISHLNERRIRELFVQEFHCPPLQYLLAVRLKHACYLLKNTTLNVSEICGQVGFEDSNYFSRCFKTHIHMSPSEFRLRGVCDTSLPLSAEPNAEAAER